VSGSASSRLHARFEWLLICVGWVFNFFFVAHGLWYDSPRRFKALQELVEKGHLSDVKWPLVGTYLSAPLFLLGKAVLEPEWWVSRYNALLLVAGSLVAWRVLTGSLRASLLRRFLLLLTSASMLPNATTTLGAETFNVAGLLVGYSAWCTDRFVLGAIVLALAVANVPPTLVGLALAMAYWGLKERRLRAAVPVVLAAGLILLENLVRHHGLWNPGYDNDAGVKTLLPYSGLPGFSYPLFFGVLSMLFAFGKGLVFFAPGLFVYFRRGWEALAKVHPLAWMWILHVVGLVLIYGRWWAWYGGYAWGPRFLLFAAIPASLFLAAQLSALPDSLVARVAVLATTVASVWVSLSGQVFGDFGQNICKQNGFFLESFCWYLPEFSVLWQPFIQDKSIGAGDTLMFVYSGAVLICVAGPLCLALVRQARDLLRERMQARANGPAWRF
jgi:hypothetical protein